MDKLTAEQIEEMAVEIRGFLLKEMMWIDVDIYFNGKRFSTYDRKNWRNYYNDAGHLLVEENVDPREYLEYAAEKHILSMAFEGPLYSMMNGMERTEERRVFDRIFEKRGLYYELGDNWNFTCYPIAG